MLSKPLDRFLKGAVLFVLGFEFGMLFTHSAGTFSDQALVCVCFIWGVFFLRLYLLHKD